MNDTRSFRWVIGLCSAMAASHASTTCTLAGPGGSPVVAGFNIHRGGVTAIDTDAAWLTQLRAAISAALPGTEFRGVQTLNGTTLNGASLLIVTSAFSGGGPFTPLSSAEVNALRSFVVGGGSALLFVDADTPSGWDIANESLINAFGIDVTGSAGPASVIDLTAFESPLISGRFGTVTSLTFTTGGWFDVIGPSAQAVGVYSGTDHAAVAYIPKGALAPGSGLVVVFGDTTLVTDGFFTPSHRIAVMNVIGLAIRGECRADFDLSGEVEVPDIFAFLSVWFAGDIVRANYNGDAFLNTLDVFTFLSDWFAGCP